MASLSSALVACMPMDGFRQATNVYLQFGAVPDDKVQVLCEVGDQRRRRVRASSQPVSCTPYAVHSALTAMQHQFLSAEDFAGNEVSRHRASSVQCMHTVWDGCIHQNFRCSTDAQINDPDQ